MWTKERLLGDLEACACGAGTVHMLVIVMLDRKTADFSIYRTNNHLMALALTLTVGPVVLYISSIFGK